MPSAQFSLLPRTLRGRLAWWYTGVIGCLVLATLAIVHFGMWAILFDDLSTWLQEDAAEIALAIERRADRLHEIAVDVDIKAASHQHEGLFVAWVTPDGRVLHATPNTPRDVVGSVAGRPSGPLVELDGYWVARHDVTPPAPAERSVVFVGANQRNFLATVWRRTEIMLLVGGLSLLVAPLGGYLLATWATAPVSDILRSAARLRPTRLDERLPVRGTGDELDLLSTTINGLLDRVAQYVSRQRQFVDHAAHDLRSPLTAVRSAVDVALGAPRSPSEYQEVLADIAEQCQDLTTLANQLLLLAECESTDAPRATECLRLDRIVERSLEMFLPVAEEKGLALERRFADCGTVLGDPRLLGQVVHNLLDNAIKFTPSGGRIEVRVDAVPEERVVRLRVADTGPGIDVDDLPHVFERFFRADRVRQRDGAARGGGLGLSICQAIVAQHGGTISIDSPAGRGTEVIVRLPVVGASPLAATDDDRPVRAAPAAIDG